MMKESRRFEVEADRKVVPIVLSEATVYDPKERHKNERLFGITGLRNESKD
jgi:hypothetical protein